MRNLTKEIDYLCFEALKGLIGMLGLLSMIFFSWVLFFWSIGNFFHQEYKEGTIVFLLWVLSIIIWRGSGTLFEKIDGPAET
jgi:heme O synthase-like polyprenyltransferase